MKIAVPKPEFFVPFAEAIVNRVYRSGGMWWADVGRGAARIVVPRRKLAIKGKRS